MGSDAGGSPLACLQRDMPAASGGDTEDRRAQEQMAAANERCQQQQAAAAEWLRIHSKGLCAILSREIPIGDGPAGGLLVATRQQLRDGLQRAVPHLLGALCNELDELRRQVAEEDAKHQAALEGVKGEVVGEVEHHAGNSKFAISADGKTIPLPCSAAAFVAKTVPFLADFQG